MANKKKISVVGNYFFVDYLDTDDITVLTRAEGLAKDVRVRTSTDVSTDFIFDNVNGVSAPIAFADMLDENGDAFADLAAWKTFYTENTGNFNSGGATPQDLESVLQQGRVVTIDFDDYIIFKDGSGNTIGSITGSNDLIFKTQQGTSSTFYRNNTVEAIGGFGMSIDGLAFPFPSDDGGVVATREWVLAQLVLL